MLDIHLLQFPQYFINFLEKHSLLNPDNMANMRMNHDKCFCIAFIVFALTKHSLCFGEKHKLYCCIISTLVVVSQYKDESSDMHRFVTFHDNLVLLFT